MAKKMQRLDESPDFRPFKFRIQAFTNAFLEEVTSLMMTTIGITALVTSSFAARATGFPRRKDTYEKGECHNRRSVGMSSDITPAVSYHRSGTFCGTNPTSHGSTKRVRSQSQKAITSGMSMRKRLRAAGSSEPSNGSSPARPLVSRTSACAGHGRRGYGTRKHRARTCP